MRKLDTAVSSIFVAMYYFTNKQLFDILCRKIQNGCEVRLIIHNNFVSIISMRLDFQYFITLGGKLFVSDEDNPMHNKFCLIDNHTVISGSYNWTYFAENKNSENILIIEQSEELATEYLAEFERLTNIYPLVHDIKSLTFTSPKSDRHRVEYLIDDVLSEMSETGNLSILQEIQAIEDTKSEPLKLMPGDKLLRLSIFAKTKSGFALLLEEGKSTQHSGTFKGITAHNNQKSVIVELYCGKQATPDRKTKLNISTTLTNLPPKPEGEVEILATASIALTGELFLTVQSKDTKRIAYARKNVIYLLK
jgi:hypothetical protein